MAVRGEESNIKPRCNINIGFYELFYLLQAKAYKNIHLCKKSANTVYKKERLAAAEALIEVAETLLEGAREFN